MATARYSECNELRKRSAGEEMCVTATWNRRGLKQGGMRVGGESGWGTSMRPWQWALKAAEGGGTSESAGGKVKEKIEGGSESGGEGERGC